MLTKSQHVLSKFSVSLTPRFESVEMISLKNALLSCKVVWQQFVLVGFLKLKLVR